MKFCFQHAKLLAMNPKLVIALAIGAICFLPVASYAGWLSWFGGVLTVMAVAAAVASVFPVPNPGIAAAAVVLGVGQVVAIVVDVYVVPKLMRPSVSQPMTAKTPEPSSYVPPDDSYLTATYPLLPLQGNPEDAMRIAANSMIAATNTLLADVNANASVAILDHGMFQLSQTVEGVANSLGAAGVTFSVLQSDIDAARADIGSFGLPAFETAYLQSAGISPADINSLAAYVASNQFNLAVPSVSADQLLRGTAQALSVPEPSTIALLSLAVLGLMLARRRR